jgi:hypothetical protein
MTKQETFYDKMPTQEQFNSFLIFYNETNKTMQENSDLRMQNYFNCVDDYSWGGLCDQAASQSYSRRRFLKDNLELQLTEGAFNQVVSLAVLADMDGNIVSDKIVKGKFGECWIIGDGNNVSFVGVAKKQATYNKKGFKVMTLAINVEYYYQINGKIESRILSQKIVDSMPDSQTTYKPSYLYFAN